MLASLIGAFVSGEAVNAFRRAKGAAIAYAFVALFALTGIGFLVGAAYVIAARRFGSVEAAIGFGVVFLLVAILILAIRSIAGSMRRRHGNRRTADLAAIAGAAAVTALPLLLRSKAGLIGPLIALAAYAVYRENRKDKADDDKGER